MTKLTEAWRERTTTERRRRQQRTQNFTVEGNTIQPKIRTATIRTIRDAIVTCAQKLTRVSLIYHTEPTTKKWKNRKTKKVKNRYAQKRRKKSPANPWNQSGRRKGGLRWKRLAEKEGFKPGMKEWRGDGWWELWVDGTDGGSAIYRTGWVGMGEISVWLTERSRLTWCIGLHNVGVLFHYYTIGSRPNTKLEV